MGTNLPGGCRGGWVSKRALALGIIISLIQRDRGKGSIRDTSIITAPLETVVESDARVTVRSERQVQVWRQWLVVLTLVFSDILLASLFFWVSTRTSKCLGAGTVFRDH